MKTTWMILSILGCVVTLGCQAASGVSTLLNDGEPDLIPLPAAGFCRDAGVVVTLRNQGPSDARSSVTTITFAGADSVQVATSSVEGGRITTLPPVAIPTACYAPNCFFQVIVDSNDDVDESDEGNNTAEVTCEPQS